jgi:adenosylcobinamide-phosphate synthase
VPFRRVCHSDTALRIGGGVMWLVVVGVTWSVAYGVLACAQAIHPWLGWCVEVWMIYTCWRRVAWQMRHGK